MLQKLLQVAQEGSLTIKEAYLGHIKKEEDRKVLSHADAMRWEELDPPVRAILEQHLFQAVEGPLGELNFPSFYQGEVLSVAKVASAEFDRALNRPAVEVLEAIRDMSGFQPEAMIDLGNAIAYKIMAAGAIKNHLVGIIRFEMVPNLGAAPVTFVFGTTCDLEDREDALFNENTGKFVTQALQNVVKKGGVSRAVLFPCLDDDGRESGDLMVYAGSGSAAWFKALESGLKLSPRREGQALVRMITAENVDGEVPHDLFRKMGESLLSDSAGGLNAERVAESLEKAVGHGIDRFAFKARWESAFGDLEYKPAYDSLFGSDEQEKPTKLKMQAGDIEIKLAPTALERFRQVTVGEQTFICFAVEQRAKVVVGKDLDLKIKPVVLDALRNWMSEDAK